MTSQTAQNNSLLGAQPQISATPPSLRLREHLGRGDRKPESQEVCRKLESFVFDRETSQEE